MYTKHVAVIVTALLFSMVFTVDKHSIAAQDTDWQIYFYNEDSGELTRLDSSGEVIDSFKLPVPHISIRRFLLTALLPRISFVVNVITIS